MQLMKFIDPLAQKNKKNRRPPACCESFYVSEKPVILLPWPKIALSLAGEGQERSSGQQLPQSGTLYTYNMYLHVVFLSFLHTLM